MIDGYCDELDIADRFANVFKNVCLPNTVDKHEQMRVLFNERFVKYNVSEVSSDFINVDTIKKCILDLGPVPSSRVNSPVS